MSAKGTFKGEKEAILAIFEEEFLEGEAVEPKEEKMLRKLTAVELFCLFIFIDRIVKKARIRWRNDG